MNSLDPTPPGTTGGSDRGGGGPGPDSRALLGAERGVSPVLALVLLTGLVAIGSVGILVAGGNVLSGTADTTGDQRAELAMQEFGSEVDAVAASEDGSREVDLAVRADGNAIVRDEASTRFVVTRYNGTAVEVVNRSIGSIVYERGDTRYAYEAGAVWEGTGRGVQQLSAPSVVYRNATLTLPLTDLQGEGEVHSDRIRASKTRTIAPLNRVSMVRGELITVQITSQYYVGWAKFFRQNVDGVSVNVDHDLQRTTVHLADPVIEGSFDTGIVASGDVYATNPSTTPRTAVRTTGDVHGDVDCGGPCETNLADVGTEPIDATVQVRTMTAKQEVPETTITGGETLTAGVYYVPDDTYLDGTSDVTVDLGNGDVTVVMDGNLGLKNTQLSVVNGSGSDGVLRVFMNHTDVALGNGAGVAVESDSAADVQFYGTSDVQFAMGQSNQEGFTGVVYAPRKSPAGGDNQAVVDMNLNNAECDTDFCIGKGSGDVTGALVGGDVTIEQNSNFTYDSSLEAVDPSVDKSAMYPPPITFLHVAVNEVEVEESR